MIRYIMSMVFSCLFAAASSQELYVFTDPASLIPAGSLSVKLSSQYPVSRYHTGFRQRYIPEVMAGVSKSIMLHLSAAASDYYSPSPRPESVKLYGQWKFFADDGVHEHFRVAAFAEGAYTRNPFKYEELNLDGDHSGFRGGLIATQLSGKFALSASGSAMKTLVKKTVHAGHESYATGALGYSLSAGYLLLPRSYSSYRQANLNVYLEMLGMQGIQEKHGMLDLAPAIQLIINSSYKINAGYRFQVSGNMYRPGDQAVHLAVEKTFLGALRKEPRKPSNE